jgi:hypothetical protein
MMNWMIYITQGMVERLVTFSKKILIGILLTIPLLLNATTYYVAPTGVDAAPPTRGTFAAPFATFQYAVYYAQAGDTVYFRGGTYTMTASDGIAIYPDGGTGYNGTAGNPICYFAYPDDYTAGNIPIFDFSSVPNTEIKKGIRSDYLEYVHFKGFEIRNIVQYNPGGIVAAIGMTFSDNVIFENVTVRNIGGAGFVTDRCISISFINCDAINCADPYSTSSSGAYGAGDGWQLSCRNVNNGYVYLKGCRSIFSSDDGYDSYWNDGTVVYDSCWALGDNHNGGEGNGWKLGRNFSTVADTLIRTVMNCISVNHHTSGFNTNHVKGHTAIYNNVSYNDSIGYYHLSSGDYNYLVTFRNNIAYDYWTMPTRNFADQPNVIHDHNSWNGVVTVSDDDFISLDTTSLYSSRQADGSLPVTNFMMLASTSDLIDAGVSDSLSTVIDLYYNGSSPDINWLEYASQNPPVTPSVVFTTNVYASVNYATIGGNVFDDGGDIVTARGICWGTTINPTVANDTVRCGVGEGTYVGTLSPLILNTTYHARAWAYNQYGYSYGEDVSFMSLFPNNIRRLTMGGKVVRLPNGKYVYITASNAAPTVLVTSINIAGEVGATTIASDDGVLQIYADVSPNNATDTTITWSRINRTGTATISSGGLLSAITDGIVTVKALANDASSVYDTLQITISNQSLVTSINVGGTGGATTISSDGGTLQMLADVSPNNAADTTITWSRTNRTGTANVNATGLLTALSDGIVTVRATANDGSDVFDTLQITLSNQVAASQIIADHTIVDRYDDIPQQWIDSVKKMWLTVPGESHSAAYRTGLEYVEALDAKYAVTVRTSGTPDPYTTANLRVSRATWGNYSSSTGWIYDYGEEDWWTNATAVSRTKAGITYANTNNLEIAAIGFGWCYDHVNYYQSVNADPVYGCRWQGTSVNGPTGEWAWGLDAEDFAQTGNAVSMDTYLSATQEYIDYCTTNGYSTKVFFTTAPVDNYYTGEAGYQGSLKQEHIREYVLEDATRILFDYADILCYDDDGTLTTTTWNGNTYPTITVTNEGDNGVGHIGSAGALRLGKAMWWMLARMAGWDGN